MKTLYKDFLILSTYKTQLKLSIYTEINKFVHVDILLINLDLSNNWNINLKFELIHVY